MSTSSGYTDDGFDDFEEGNDDPDGEGEEIIGTSIRTPITTEESSAVVEGRSEELRVLEARRVSMQKENDMMREMEVERMRERERGWESERERAIERDRERREIEAKLERLRHFEAQRRQQRELEEYMSSQKSSQRGINEHRARGSVTVGGGGGGGGGGVNSYSNGIKKAVKSKGIKSIAEARALIEAQKRPRKKSESPPPL